MTMAIDALGEPARVVTVSEPTPPPLVGVPAPEYWWISHQDPALRCAWCGSDAVGVEHWLTRCRARICLDCKSRYRGQRGVRQVSPEECLRVIQARLDGCSQAELAALKAFEERLSLFEDSVS
jgi:hypothetical protein